MDPDRGLAADFTRGADTGTPDGVEAVPELYAPATSAGEEEGATVPEAARESVRDPFAATGPDADRGAIDRERRALAGTVERCALDRLLGCVRESDAPAPAPARPLAAASWGV